MSRTRQNPAIVTGRRTVAAGALIAAHRHSEHQVVYGAEGRLAVTTAAGVLVTASAGAVWIPAGIHHEHRALRSTELVLVGLAPSEIPWQGGGPTVLSVAPLLRNLMIAATTDPSMGHEEMQRLRGVLLDQLRRALDQPNPVRVPEDPRLLDLWLILDADPADRRTLAALGKQVGASDRTLSRLCHLELGMTFPRWRTHLRLQHASSLLKAGGSVTQVAHQCGWSSASAFIQVFRQNFGYTPGSSRLPHTTHAPVLGGFRDDT